MGKAACEMNSNPKFTKENLEDLYCGLVAGVWGNLGSGKTPELIEGIGPDDKHSNRAYGNLYNQLVSFHYDLADTTVEVSDEVMAESFFEATKLNTEYIQDPEKWLIGIRDKAKTSYSDYKSEQS